MKTIAILGLLLGVGCGELDDRPLPQPDPYRGVGCTSSYVECGGEFHCCSLQDGPLSHTCQPIPAAGFIPNCAP